MALAKCYALIHAIAVQNGANTVWADENADGQTAQLQQAREILRRNHLFT